jgi:ATP-dependent RNA helicase DDX19/DBP5
MLYRINTKSNTTQALCVTPTRELAIQIVDKAIVPMSVNMEPKLIVQLAIAQCDKPNYTPHVVVGTPGKIVDWMKRRIIVPNTIKVFVLDEADTMVEAGSGHRANSLLIQKQLHPKQCQYLFFSATFSTSVLQFATKMIHNADKILIDDGEQRPESLVLDVIKQLWVDTRTYHGSKLEFLADIYSLLTIGQSIVFVGRKDDADAIYTTLQQSGYTCSLLHGAVEPAIRDTVMDAFRNGQSNVLITTNVLARGVDVRTVPILDCRFFIFDCTSSNSVVGGCFFTSFFYVLTRSTMFVW